jgi:predicted lipoprotein with Yx(FWY)xxD motif
MSDFMKGYEDAAARVLRFHTVHPVGRIETSIINHNPVQGLILVEARVYREHEDTLPAGIDYAFGERDSYSPGMRKWYVEDTVTSAIARCISLVIPTDKKATAENMAQVQYTESKPANKSFKEKLDEKVVLPVEDDPWTMKAVEPAGTIADAVALMSEVMGATKIDKDIPHCSKCHDNKPMTWKTGVSAKNNKAWGNFSCFACKDVIWYEIAPNGSWQPQKNKW